MTIDIGPFWFISGRHLGLFLIILSREFGPFKIFKYIWRYISNQFEIRPPEGDSPRWSRWNALFKTALSLAWAVLTIRQILSDSHKKWFALRQTHVNLRQRLSDILTRKYTVAVSEYKATIIMNFKESKADNSITSTTCVYRYYLWGFHYNYNNNNTLEAIDHDWFLYYLK